MDLTAERRQVSMPIPAEFPCCKRGASLGDDRLTEIAGQLAAGADEVILDRKCQGVACKDPDTGRRGIRYRVHIRYSPANGLCGPDFTLLRAEWERVGIPTPAPVDDPESKIVPTIMPEPVMFPPEQDWVDEVDKITPAVIRAWAIAQGLPCGARGRIHPSVTAQYQAAHA